MNWSLAPGNSYKMHSRLIATGADGSITYDSDWTDMTPYNNEWILGGASGTSTFTIDGNTDISGGVTLTDQFTNVEGQNTDEWGETIPPDPVTGTC